MYRLLLLTFLLINLHCLAAPTALHNARGYTLNLQGDLQTFSTLVIDNGKVLATGNASLLSQYPSAKIIDMQQQTLIPGLIDAHGHLLGLGANLLRVDLRDIASAGAAVNKVAAYAANHPKLSWITGRGWNQEQWKTREFPTAAQLDAKLSKRPVWLRRVDGHAGWANSKAMEIAGITRQTADPTGGKIIRDANGQATGVLIDNAMALVEKYLPKASKQRYQQQLQAATRHLLALGVTSMHDAGISEGEYQFYLEQARNNALSMRIYAMLSASDPALANMLQQGHQHGQRGLLKVASVKAYADGALGSRGAALLEPYSDAPTNKGLLVTKQQDLARLFDLVLGQGFQLNVHAIGDRANRLVLDQFADTFARYPHAKALRNRIEHAQVVSLDDIGRFKTLDILPSMQPTHATSDMHMAEHRVGENRLRGAYAWQRFLAQGSPLVFGSDFPVELANPFYGLHAAVTRQDRNNQPRTGWRAEEALNIEQAFRAFTLNAAYAAGQEHEIGTLLPGHWADFIVLDRNIFTLPADQLWQTQVNQTWLAGKRVY